MYVLKQFPNAANGIGHMKNTILVSLIFVDQKLTHITRRTAAKCIIRRRKRRLGEAQRRRGGSSELLGQRFYGRIVILNRRTMDARNRRIRKT